MNSYDELQAVGHHGKPLQSIYNLYM